MRARTSERGPTTVWRAHPASPPPATLPEQSIGRRAGMPDPQADAAVTGKSCRENGIDWKFIRTIIEIGCRWVLAGKLVPIAREGWKERTSAHEHGGRTQLPRRLRKRIGFGGHRRCFSSISYASVSKALASCIRGPGPLPSTCAMHELPAFRSCALAPSTMERP
jgi:hypothetical protein